MAARVAAAKARKIPAGEAAGLVASGMWIDYGVALSQPDVVDQALAWELVQTFLAARFSGAERHRRRLAKVAELENTPPKKAA